MQALQAAGTGRQFALVAKSSGEVVGTLLIFRFDAGAQRAEVGYLRRG